MDCYYHPGRESTNNCTVCGKSICDECSVEIAGKVYCKDCLEKIIGKSDDTQTTVDETPSFEQSKYDSFDEPITQEETKYSSFDDDFSYDEEPSLFNNQNSYRDEAPSRESIIKNVLEDENTQKQEVHQFKPVEESSPYNVNSAGYQQQVYEERSYFSQEEQKPQFNPDEMYSSQNTNPQNEIYQQQRQPQFNQESLYEPQIERPQNEIYQQQRQPQFNQNEFNQPQNNDLQDDGFIYPDHSYQPEEIGQNSLEDKYEKYLDDLYFDDEEESQIPLSEQLAQDEEEYGSLTQRTYKPREPKEETRTQEDIYYEQQMMKNEPYSTYDSFETADVNYSQPNQQNITGQYQEETITRAPAPQQQDEGTLEDEIRRKIAAEREAEIKPSRKSIHNTTPSKPKREKEPLGIVDIILTIILIIVILIVIFYILYLFLLSSYYPTFTDAIYGLTDPQSLINHLMGK